MLNKDDMSTLYKVFTFWDKLSSTEKEIIQNNLTRTIYKKGENIHSADHNCVGILIIISGSLRTYILSEDGREITLYRLDKEDVCVLSATCILKNITFDVHIDAEVDSEILLINSAAFSQIATQNIYVENYINKEAVERFSDVMWAMEQILFMKFDQRLAIFLLDEIIRIKSNTISLTHEQIAKYMGSAREVVTRMLKYFVKEGVVEISRGKIKVIDENRLKKYCK